MLEHTEIIRLMRDVLEGEYTQLEAKRVTIEENLVEQTTTINCVVTEGKDRKESVIDGKGVGVVDALFKGVVSRFASDYPSLKTIRFTAFTVNARMDTKQAFAGSDSSAEVTVEIANSEDKRHRFSHTSRSVLASSIVATLAALEYFINSEKAFIKTYRALKNAKERNRADLIQRFTNMLSTLVENTSYSEVIEKIRSELS